MSIVWFAYQKKPKKPWMSFLKQIQTYNAFKKNPARADGLKCLSEDRPYDSYEIDISGVNIQTVADRSGYNLRVDNSNGESKYFPKGIYVNTGTFAGYMAQLLRNTYLATDFKKVIRLSDWRKMPTIVKHAKFIPGIPEYETTTVSKIQDNIHGDGTRTETECQEIKQMILETREFTMIMERAQMALIPNSNVKPSPKVPIIKTEYFYGSHAKSVFDHFAARIKQGEK